ncbi:MAG: hypothetical protein K8L91_08460 [Anaerolineae bacterium]|nr:hypothetical protein [Anaerolineae bacterium]
MKKFIYNPYTVTIAGSVIAAITATIILSNSGNLVRQFSSIMEKFFGLTIRLPMFVFLLAIASLILIPVILKLKLLPIPAIYKINVVGFWRVLGGIYCLTGKPTEKCSWEIKLKEANGNGFYGPYITLRQGYYRVIFRLKISNNEGHDNIGLLDVVSGTGPAVGTTRHAETKLSASHFVRSEGYQEFKLEFSLEKETEGVEFRVNVAKDQQKERSLSLDYIALVKIS